MSCSCRQTSLAHSQMHHPPGATPPGQNKSHEGKKNERTCDVSVTSFFSISLCEIFSRLRDKARASIPDMGCPLGAWRRTIAWAMSLTALYQVFHVFDTFLPQDATWRGGGLISGVKHGGCTSRRNGTPQEHKNLACSRGQHPRTRVATKMM